MKKIISCKECLHVTSEEVVCDTCGKQLTCSGYYIEEIGKMIHIELKINGTDYEFCSLKCLNKFIEDEIKKEN